MMASLIEVRVGEAFTTDHIDLNICGARLAIVENARSARAAIILFKIFI